MPVRELASLFQTFDEHGNAIESSELPLAVALGEQKSSHKRMTIRGLDGRKRQIEVTAIPIIGQHKQLAGAATFFWEVKEPKK